MPFTATQLTTFYTNENLGITPTAAEALLIQAYATENASGSLSDAQALANILAFGQDKTDVALATYQFFTGATPSLTGLAFLVHGGGNPNDLSSPFYAGFNKENRYYNFAINLATDPASAASATFASQWGSLTFAQAVQVAYEQIVGSAVVGVAQATAAEASITAAQSFFASIAAARAPNANQDLATKAIMIGYVLEEAIKADVGVFAKGIDGFMGSLAQTGTAITGNLLVNYPANAVGQAFTLTSGIDTFSGGGGNDTVSGNAAGLSPLDNINGGGGSNVLSITDNAAIGPFSPASTVVNFQTVNLSSVAGVTADVSGFVGTTQLTVLSGGTATLTAGATTSVTDASVGGDSITGGNNVTVTNFGGTDQITGPAGAILVSDTADVITITKAAGAVTVSEAKVTTGAISIDGGTSVTVNATGETTGTITIGAVSAPTGAVTVNSKVVDNAGLNVTGGAVAITGGTTDAVNLSAGNAVNTTVTFGAVTVTGTATTTSVSVAEAGPATAAAKVAGVADGNVTISDANAASLTKAGTITSVSLGNFAAATINDNAMTSLTLAGAGAGVTINDNLTTPTVTSLALTTTGYVDAVGLIDTHNEISTINLTNSGSSKIGGFTDTGLKTLAISGAGTVALTAVPGSLTSLTVSGAAGFTGDISGVAGLKTFAPTSTGTITVTVNGTTQTFAGGPGTDIVSLGTDAVKTITGGSAGNNEIILTATAATYATPANITGFQTLGVNGAASGSYDLSKFVGVTALDVINDGGAVVFTKVNPGTTLSLDGTLAGGAVTYQAADSTGATDSVSVSLGTAAAAGVNIGQQLTLEDNVLAGIGNVTINSVAAPTVAPAPPNTNILPILNDTGLTSLTFTGAASTTISSLVDNGNTVTITNAGSALATIGSWVDNNLKSLTLNGNVGLTLNDNLASGVTVAGGGDNANVSLTLAGKADTINLGTGTDVVTDSGAGAISVTVAGAATGTDVITVNNATTATIIANAGANTITANSTGTNAVTIGATGAAAESVVFGLGTNTATFGAHTGADNVSVLAHNAAASFNLAAVATGLNSAATGADTITFGSDAGATGAVTVVTTTQINAYANATGQDATQLITAVNAALDATNGGAGIAQHHVAEFSFQGNTYIVEQADTTGHNFFAGNEGANLATVVELVGVVPITGASSAAAGVLTLHG